MSTENYHRKMLGILSSLGRDSGPPRLLLHCCCSPCASRALECLAPYFDITLFFYNPCIQPRGEYERRLESLRLLLLRMESPGYVGLLEPGWRGGDFEPVLAGGESEPEGGARCLSCYRQRLGETARLAREGGYGYICSTLTVGPRKDADKINAAGYEAAGEQGVLWLPSDFKKEDGYRRSVELSRRYGLYRQDYCGCSASAADRRSKK